MKTPDYKLTADYKHWWNSQDYITLKAGEFVRPIEFCYLPKELQEKFRVNKNYDEDAYCHTKVGIINIPKTLLRKTNE